MYTTLRYLLAILILLAFSSAHADYNQCASETSWRASYEIIPIIGDEMGVLGVHYDFLPMTERPDLYLGLGGYGGLTGEEGGFFTVGVTLGQRTSLSDKLKLDLGLHLGGGGGSRFTFPGGGMIIRPHAALELQQGNYSWRLGLAHTRFPNSTNPDNQNTHLFVGLRKQSFDWRQGGGSSIPFAGNHATFRASAAALYYLTDDNKPLLRDGRFTGNGENRDIPLLGFKVEQFYSRQAFLGLEVYGAGGGGADGYAAFLGSLGHTIPLGRYLQWENKLTMGMAGDGRLDTGGGLVGQFTTNLNLALSEHWYLRAGIGRIKALQGDFAATVLDFGIGWQASRPLATAGASGLFSTERYQAIPWLSSLAHKTYLPKPHTRNKSGNPYHNQLHLIGLSLQRALNEWFSLSGSTHWAYEGNIGSYAEGLLGVNIHPTLSDTAEWRFKLGYELGVAGGGVMDIDGGVIHQANLGLLYQINNQLSIDFNIGRMESQNRTFQADVLLLQLNWHHDSLFLK